MQMGAGEGIMQAAQVAPCAARLSHLRTNLVKQPMDVGADAKPQAKLGGDTEPELGPSEAEVPWPARLATNPRETETPPIDKPAAHTVATGTEEMEKTSRSKSEQPSQEVRRGEERPRSPGSRPAAPRGAAAACTGSRLGMNRPLREIAQGATTLCVRNVPSRYGHEQLLQEWTDLSSLDFLYHPYGFAAKKNLGFVIINFVSPEAAVAFQRQWHGKRLSDHGGTRALDIVTGQVQGYRALLVSFAAKILATKKQDVLPVLLAGGRFLDPHQEARYAVAFQYQ